MPMPDLPDSIRNQLRARLDELRPLVSEYERLHQAAQALRSNRPAAESRTQARNPRPPRRSRARPDRTSNTAAERANSRTTLLALIGARPGITKAELKTASGLSSGSAAQNVRRLVARGELREESLSGGQTGYRLSDTDNAGTSK
jgi:hypothetical protein